MDFLLGILESNVNYNNIILIVFLYIFLLWLMLSFWVGMDAKKRYANSLIAVGFGLLVLILNIPALVFYLIIRPEKDEDNILYLHSDENTLGGVNVPIVNFTGNDGFVISLQLKVGNTQSSVNGENNMNINVEFDSNNKNMNLQPKREDTTANIIKNNGVNKLTVTVKEKTGNISSKINKIVKNFANNLQNYAKNIESDTEKGKEK